MRVFNPKYQTANCRTLKNVWRHLFAASLNMRVFDLFRGKLGFRYRMVMRFKAAECSRGGHSGGPMGNPMGGLQAFRTL
jgi:hypothetical protein